MDTVLRPGHSIAHDVNRLVLKELRAARAELRVRPIDDAAIHAARKRVKSVRAVLRLLGPSHSPGLAQAHRHLRAASRMLSPLRDSAAVLDALHVLRVQSPGLFRPGVFDQLRHRLLTKKRLMLSEAVHDGSLRSVRAHLRKAEASARGWRAGHHGARNMAAGLTASHRRSRAAMLGADRGRLAAQFHEWRKQLKSLWCQMRLLGPLGADLDDDVSALHHAESLLGEDHNMVLLKDVVLAEIAGSGLAVDPAGLRRAAARYQRDQRASASAAVRGICTHNSRQYAAGVRRALDARMRAC